MKYKYNIQLASHDACTGCAACVSICPKGCISMQEDREGFLQPHIDAETCIGCHKCEKTCPIVTPKEIPTEFETQAYAAINKDEGVRMRSSSGGMFHALAKWTIEQGGVVFGARFDDNWEVVHDYAETMEGIEPFMRSKYVQSRVGETYKQAKQYLEQGRWVLYSGTPCQIGGLHAYLSKDYEKLLLVDLICHGVPGSGVWRRYLHELANGETINGINFRDKIEGWKESQGVISTNTASKRMNRTEDLYFKGFLHNVFLRRSCYECQFKQVHRISDITMADAWGVEYFSPEMDDNKGTSAVFAHTKKGWDIARAISENIKIKPINIADVIAHNESMVESVRKPSKRSKFYFFGRFMPFSYLTFAIDKDWLYVRILRKMKKIFR